jgi:hypothetical protein
MLHKLGVFCDISPTSFSLSIFQVLSALLEHQSVTILSLIVPQFIAAITLCSNNYFVFFIVFIALLGSLIMFCERTLGGARLVRILRKCSRLMTGRLFNLLFIT